MNPSSIPPAPEIPENIIYKPGYSPRCVILYYKHIKTIFINSYPISNTIDSYYK